MNKPHSLLVEHALAADRILREAVTAHEAKNGPDLPTSKAPGWQAARELLVAIEKARDAL